MMDVSVGRNKENLSFHSVEFSLDGIYQIFEKLFMSEIGACMIRMLNKDVSSANILIVYVNKGSH